MKELRLLIVDDVEDNRLVLHAICRKIDALQIQEATDGLEAIEKTVNWHPHIILMDVMMPNLDGFEASKVIKQKFPDTIIMIITAVVDPQMEVNMASIGVNAYLHKPIDKELVRFKLQNFAALVRSKEGDYTQLSSKKTLNPFCNDVRHYKIIFDIVDSEGMMDFGVWLLTRCEHNPMMRCSKVDLVVELFYALMQQVLKEYNILSIIIEESFEEIFLTMQLPHAISLKPTLAIIVEDLQHQCVVQANIVCVRLFLQTPSTTPSYEAVSEPLSPVIEVSSIPENGKGDEEIVILSEEKTTRHIDATEKELLRQSFVAKTPALEYVNDIGGDVLDEIRDLESLDNEWSERLAILESEPSLENIKSFVDGVLGVYVRAINNLFEFTALAYALSSLGAFMKGDAETIIEDASKMKVLVMLTEHLGSDLRAWRQHIFELQDATDIHYLDSSFFSSCMQIEQIIGNQNIDSDHDSDMEFF